MSKFVMIFLVSFSVTAEPITQYGGVGKGAPNAQWIFISPNHPFLGWSLAVIGIGFLLYCWWGYYH